ncbi:MAG: inositol monophosphatase [Ignavibacteriae bacterium]|nr:inositol monophosphatase [Ignavibacteriota bacterium]
MINKIINIAKEAGEIIRDGFRENISIEFKTGENNLVTNIDKAAEKIILDFIKKDYSTHSIIAEESGTDKKSSEYTWVVDPLDGTTNFAHGIPIFGVSIGLQRNNQTVLGVIYDVMRDVVYSAEKGSGSYENDKKILVTNNALLSHSVLVTDFPYDLSNSDDAIRIFGTFLNNTRAVRYLGSAAIDMCYVAAGVFDGSWQTDLQPWDVCAGMLIVEEAGGKLSDYKGEPIDIFSNQFLTTNGLVHNAMLEVFNKDSSKSF